VTEQVDAVGRFNRETRMNGKTVLLRAVDGAQEGWKLMSFDEFLRQINIESWNSRQALVGMVLPPSRSERLQ
jgi:hypothetical protein